MTETSSFPVIEVSHLPSASSFYATVLQPLGLQYLSTSTNSNTTIRAQYPASYTPNRTRLNFGHHHSPTTNQPITVFALTQATPSLPPQPTLIRLPALSPSAVASFYNKALLANSAQRDRFFFERSSDEESRAKIQDLDGNMIEAVYSSRAGRRVPTIETASTEKEARRVLAWQEEVARSTAASDHASSAGAGAYEPPPPAQYRRADTFPRTVAERSPRLVKRETVTTEHYKNEQDRAALDSRGGAGGNGFTGMKIAGILLGAAAGGLIAHAMVRSESPPRLAPPPRRASYGDRGPEYTHVRPVEPVRTTVERPPRSYVSSKEPPRYVEYRIAPPPAPSAALAQDIARIEERSHVSRRSRDSERGSRHRSRSEVGSQRPLTILPPRARSPGSHVSHRSHKSSSHAASKRDRESESYVSARSHRSESTVKPVQPVLYLAPSSKVTTTKVRVVPEEEERRSEISYARHVPLPRSEISARQVPLPQSTVGGRGYAVSVAPSDSVSSIGSKRERERLRERMSARGDRW